jgi:hypothetical protein
VLSALGAPWSAFGDAALKNPSPARARHAWALSGLAKLEV